MESWVSFVAASVLLTLAPGPDIMYLIAKSLADGAKCGIALAGGLVSGVAFHTALVMVGVAALIKGSPLALAALKYLGAAYLLYLAWGAAHDTGAKLQRADNRRSYAALYRRGVMMNVLNPKVLLFFLAFLPQFVTAEGNTATQIALLGAVFSLQAFLLFTAVAVFAGHVRGFLTGQKTARTLALLQAAVLVIIAGGILFA